MSHIRQQIITRLQSTLASDFRFIGGAADLKNIEASNKIMPPACFVMLLKTDASENKTLGRVTQTLTNYFGFIIAVQNRKNDRGDDSSDVIEDLRVKIRDVLTGWNPEASECPGYLLYSGGEMLNIDVKRNLFYWNDIYKITTIIRSAN